MPGEPAAYLKALVSLLKASNALDWIRTPVYVPARRAIYRSTIRTFILIDLWTLFRRSV